MRVRVAVIAAVLTLIAVACGIPASGDVSRIPANKIEALTATVPTTSTTTTTTTIPVTTLEPTTTTQPAITATTIAQQEFTLYFISGGILRPLTRLLSKGASSSEVIRSLQDGTPAGDVGLRSAVPPYGVSPLSVNEDGSGVATVDLPANFFAIVPPEDQRFAIGQIVLTLTKVAGIGQVRFTQDGAAIGVPRGAGDLSAPGQPLPPRDYAELLESPAVTTTTAAPTQTAAG